MVPLEALGWFMLGAGVTSLAVGLFHLVNIIMMKRRMLSFIDKIKEEAPEFLKDQAAHIEKGKGNGSGKEIIEMTFHDKEGNLNTIKIIIDHDLPDISLPDREQFKEMVLKGEAGRISDMVSGHKVSEKAMEKVQEFIFSPQAVRDMRRAGMEPDEVVTKMLKASGRMEGSMGTTKG